MEYWMEMAKWDALPPREENNTAEFRNENHKLQVETYLKKNSTNFTKELMRHSKKVIFWRINMNIGFKKLTGLTLIWFHPGLCTGLV